MDERAGYHVSLLKCVRLTKPKKKSSGTVRCFRSVLVAKKLYGRERGKSRISVALFLYHSTEKNSLGTLWCFRNFPVAKNFHGCEDDITFPDVIFLSHIGKNFLLELFGV